ncbi:hypothetical protein [Oceanithermus sp.]
MIAYGVIHGAFVAIAVAAQNAAALGLPADALAQTAIRSNDLLRNVTMVPVAVFTLLFTWLVLAGMSHYPRWVALFNPGLLFPLKQPLLGWLSSPAQVVVGGGFFEPDSADFLSIFYAGADPKKVE